MHFLWMGKCILNARLSLYHFFFEQHAPDFKYISITHSQTNGINWNFVQGFLKSYQRILLLFFHFPFSFLHTSESLCLPHSSMMSSPHSGAKMDFISQQPTGACWLIVHWQKMCKPMIDTVREHNLFFYRR